MITLNFNSTTLSVQENDTSYLYRKLQDKPQLVLKFSLTSYVDIPVGAYCDYKGVRYTMWTAATFKKQGERNIEYTLTLCTDQELLSHYILRNTVDRRLKWSMCARPHEFAEEIVNNLNARAGTTLWSVGTCLESTEKTIEFNHTTIAEAVSQVASTFETEWEIENYTLSFKRVEYNKDNPIELSYGRGNGFVPGVGRAAVNDKPPIDVLFVQGGDRNIDRSKYGAKELLLPQSQTLSYDGTHFEDEQGYDATKAKTFASDADGYSVHRVGSTRTTQYEESLDCSEIYPSRVGTVTSVEVINESKHFYDIIDNTIPAALNFNDYIIGDESMTLIFQSGMLAGREFEIQYKHSERRFRLVPDTFDDVEMPNSTFAPAVNDTYAIFGCMLPDAYICDNQTKSGASWDMMREAVRYLFDHEDQEFTFTGTLQAKWARDNWLSIGGKLKVGGYVEFSDTQFAPDGVLIRIVGIKEFLTAPYSITLEISNATQGGSFSSTMRELEGLEVVIDDTKRELVQYTRRRFRDAQETMTMLESSLLNYSNSVNPITVQTMAALIGDESLQFRFITARNNPTVQAGVVSYNQQTKVLTCAATFLQHMTLGVDMSSSHNLNEYKIWQMQSYTSPALDTATQSYYLYAKVAREDTTTAGEFVLSATAIAMTSVSNYYHLLVGILNSEYDGERSFAAMYGFTEILPGRVTTQRIVSEDGTTYFDLANGEIGGIIKFLNGNNYETIIDGGYIKTNLINAQMLEVARVLAGNADGKRVVINPDDKAVYIYDENNELVTVFEGNSYSSINDIFGDTSGTATMTDASDGVDHDYTTDHDSETYTGETVISDLFNTATPAIITFGGTLYARVVSDVNMKEVGYAHAYLRLYVETYDDAQLTNRIQRVYVTNCGCFVAGDETQSQVEYDSASLSLSSKKVKVVAGYHRVVLEWEMQANNYFQNTDEAHVSWSNVTAAYNTEFYISRFFANGFAIGTRRNNYVLALNDPTDGMLFSVESNGCAFEIGTNGIRYKRVGDTTWRSL